jgi:transcriptional regulator with XRE-family HTH domain
MATKARLAEIATTIAQQRSAKGLTQTSLGQLLGLPQSHISRVEAGRVDLRTSSLLDLARALDLEVMLIPRKLVPAVRAQIQEEPEHGDDYLYRLRP